MTEQNSLFISESLGQAYLKAIYRVFVEDVIIKMTINKQSCELKTLMESLDVETGAIITGFNPYGEAVSADASSMQNQQLLKDVQENNWKYFLADGVDPEHKWPAEESFFIVGIDLDEARQLALKYEQLAFVMISKLGFATLRATDPSQQDKVDSLLKRMCRRLEQSFRDAGIEVTHVPSNKWKSRTNFISRKK